MYNYLENLTKHKVFTSYYHKDDQYYKNYIDNYFGNNIVNKSVMDGDINPDDKDEYVKMLIRNGYISDSSVIVVLIGKNTKTRKHVDWEIYAGLRQSVNGNSGLVGVLLPGMEYTNSEAWPERLADNVKTGYCKVYSWDYFKNNFNKVINDAYNNRITLREKIDNSRLQMKYNTTGYYNSSF